VAGSKERAGQEIYLDEHRVDPTDLRVHVLLEVFVKVFKDEVQLALGVNHFVQTEKTERNTKNMVSAKCCCLKSWARFGPTDTALGPLQKSSTPALVHRSVDGRREGRREGQQDNAPNNGGVVQLFQQRNLTDGGGRDTFILGLNLKQGSVGSGER
jgi:hypothetical protein